MRGVLWMGLLCIVATATWPLEGRAQQFTPGGEVFGGYSYLRSSSGSGYNANGWEGSLTGNFNRFFGLEVNLADHYAGQPPGYSNGLSFLFGPHFTFRAAPRVNPFAHFLVGGTRGTQAPLPVPVCPLAGTTFCVVGAPCPPCPPGGGGLHETAFSTAVGGGLDVKATRFVWIRVFQADYLREFFRSNTQNDLRISFGVVLRFGS